MKRLPTFVAGMLTAAVIGGLGVGALAASGQLTISVDPVNIQVNGETFQPKDANGKDVPVFAYQGTTYAPLRALAEAYGLTVGYSQSDGEVNVLGAVPEMEASQVYIDGAQFVVSNATINERAYIPIASLESGLGCTVTQSGSRYDIHTATRTFGSALTDKNGNRIIGSTPENFTTGNYFLWNYLDIVFDKDTKNGDISSKTILTNLNTGAKVKVKTQPGATLPNNFLVIPNNNLELGASYSLYIPSGSIKFVDGTAYDEDIRLIFKMAETIVTGKIAAPQDIAPQTPIALIADDGTRYENRTWGGNEFFIADMPSGKYSFELDGSVVSSMTVSGGKVNKVKITVE